MLGHNYGVGYNVDVCFSLEKLSSFLKVGTPTNNFVCADLEDEFTVVYFTSTVQNSYHFLVAQLLYAFSFF